MAGDVRRVTVQGAGHRVDLTVPARLPIVELIPAVASLCQAGPAATHVTPPAWGLARIGAAPFRPSASLEQVEVVDGDVLWLVDTAVWEAPVVRTAAEAVADAVRASPRWDATARTAVLTGLAAAQLVVAAVIGAAAAGGSLTVRLAVGTAAAAVAALAASRMARALAPGAAVAAGSLAVGALAVALGAAPAQVAAVVVVAGVAALRVLPPALNRTPARAGAGAGPEALAAAAGRARQLLASLSAGTALTVLAASIVLVGFGDLVAGVLAAVASLALLLQVPTYRFLREAVPLALAAGASFLAMEAAVAARLLLPEGLPAAGVGLLLAGGAAALAASFVRRPLAAAVRWAELTWPVVDAAMVPLALAELGAFAALGRLVRLVVG